MALHGTPAEDRTTKKNRRSETAQDAANVQEYTAALAHQDQPNMEAAQPIASVQQEEMQ